MKEINHTPCGCTLKCYDRIQESQRQAIFDGFWQISNFDVQNAYLCGCVKIMNIKKRYTSTKSRRDFSRVYYINNGGVSDKICKTAFLRIHGISNGRLDRVLKGQMKQGGVPQQDQRGRHVPANKTKEEDLACVRQHINTFPKYKSHYSRADNPHREYLSPDLSVSKMHTLYSEFCTSLNKQPVSEWVYRKVFNEEFNLYFGRYIYIYIYICMLLM